MSGLIALTLRAPLAILAVSYFVGLIVRMIPIKGDEWFTLDRAPAE
jgi:hypothetical protein